jgi:wyosine [tRNA(Phe)-imidazoG37] synthetase (radical SAM superfamily)
MQERPRGFIPTQQVVDEVSLRVRGLEGRGERVDFLTFVPDGEPTLDEALGEAVDQLKDLLHIPVAVISNGSLLWREEVRHALHGADWVSLKVDACREAVWRAVNRPHPRLRLEEILEGIRVFAREYKGRLVTETMLVDRLNEGAEDMKVVASFLAQLAPETAYLSIPTRPPAKPWVRAPGEAAVNRAFQILSEAVPRVELLTGYEGADFACSGETREDLLAMASVHPIREDGLRRWIEKAGADWSLVKDLLRDASLVTTAYNGRRFFLRNLRGTVPQGS